ncbi:MAG TPA: hypothetical protein GXX75_02260 [Clostridiales bacterium]|nr:hypothetical protein [Clostridiales bacterium]
MKKLSKLLFSTIVASIMVFIPTISVNAKIVETANIGEIQKILDTVNKVVEKESANINYFENGTKSIDVYVDGKKEGTVTFETKKIDTGSVHPNWEGVVTDGNWVHTRTYDIGVSGSATLQTNYTVSGMATRITPTSTTAYATPPVGYKLDTTSSYYSIVSSDMFNAYGSYTYSIPVINLPLTYKITCGFWIFSPDAEGKNLVISSGISL